MQLNEAQREKFAVLAEPMMQWLAENTHPHTAVQITSTSAELTEGVLCHYNESFIKG